MVIYFHLFQVSLRVLISHSEERKVWGQDKGSQFKELIRKTTNYPYLCI